MKKLNMAINPGERKSIINKEIYGHFSEHLGRCIYEGIYVGENSSIPNTDGIRNDVIEALKQIKIPVLRWPGGCFADEYHWRDGIGEKSKRGKMINTHWGGVVEDNSFGTHEFMRLCELIECEPYINGNVGSGTVQEMSEWVEYLTSDCMSERTEERKRNGREKPWRLKYFAVGNENWGCGGDMRPEYYADEYRRYACYCRNYGENKLYKVACGPSGDDYNWTEKLMSGLKGRYANAISLHYYTGPCDPGKDMRSATKFDDYTFYTTLFNASKMQELISRHIEIMNRYDPEHRVDLIVDEWGTWYNVEEGTNPGFLYQQSTMRDALVAAVTLNIFNQNSDRVKMANIAQTVNVLQAVILTEGEKMIKTPTYHIFDMYKKHQQSTLVHSFIEETRISEFDRSLSAVTHSVSADENGGLFLTISNCSLTEEYEIDAVITDGIKRGVKAQILTGDMKAHNTFDSPENVLIKAYDGVKSTASGITVKLPKCSVISIELK